MVYIYHRGLEQGLWSGSASGEPPASTRFVSYYHSY